MRIVLMTGKGGVGKTTVSGATALSAARRGVRTLVVSTDAAHSLADVLAVELGSEVRTVAPNLDGLHLDGRCELERSWAVIGQYLRRLLEDSGVGYLHTEELLAVPGLEQMLALVRLREYVESGSWDAVIIDCAPSADSLRLLALPDAISFYLTRLFGRSGTMNVLARRSFERAFSVPTPSEEVVSSVRMLVDEASRVQAMFAQATTTARIVVTPERIVVAEGRRTMSYLALYGYSVDAVVVNRVFDLRFLDTALRPWVEAQQTQLRSQTSQFAGLPQLVASHQAVEPIGISALQALGEELYRDRDPLAVMAPVQAMSISTDRDEAVVRLPIGQADRRDIVVYRRNGELVVGLNGHRRAVLLPDSLQHQEVKRAGVADGCLEVVFGRGADVRL